MRTPKAIVIGSGFGGLAAAIRLSCKGYDVQVLDKLDAPGGRAYVHRQDGFTFDGGPTIITAPQLLEELWTLCGKRMSDHITLKPMEPFYRIRFDDGSWFDYSGDEATMRREVARFCEADLPGFDRFIAAADQACKLGFEDLGGMPFNSFSDLLAALPSMVKMMAWESLYTLVSRHISDPKLRIVFSFHPLLIGGNPFAVTRVYSLINTLERRWGVHWAMGGTGALVQGLVNLLSERGVRVRCNAPVTRINIEQGRARGVTLENGERLDADIVVSNGDPAWTYRYLVDAQHRRHWTDRKVARGKYSMSLFVWYFGTNRRYHDVPHHMIMLGPRYRELLDDIFKHHHLADDYSLYLHRPSASDPGVAPADCDAFYVLAPVPHLGSGTDWSSDAERFRQSIQRYLENTVLPDLGEHVVTSKLMTPQDFQDRLWSYQGAAFGLEPTLLQSAWFRPHNRSEDVEGLYMVGAGTHPGAGVPGVLMSAKAMSTVIPDA
ncbi:MAG: phytoene desaturase [Oxalobacteraceae bacterium]